MQLIIVVASLFAIPCFCSAAFHKKCGDTLALSLGGIILFLYGFYILDRLLTGYYLLLALLLCCYIGAALLVVLSKNKRDFLHCFFSPGFVVALILVVLYRAYLKNNVPIAWDE